MLYVLSNKIELDLILHIRCFSSILIRAYVSMNFNYVWIRFDILFGWAVSCVGVFLDSVQICMVVFSNWFAIVVSCNCDKFRVSSPLA